MEDRSLLQEALAAPRFLLLTLGAVLAFMAWLGAYDVSGREPPCFDAQPKLQQSHPDVVDFRNTGGGYSLTQSCEAVDANGVVLGRMTYPGSADWVLIVVVLVGPLLAHVAWRRFRT